MFSAYTLTSNWSPWLLWSRPQNIKTRTHSPVEPWQYTLWGFRLCYWSHPHFWYFVRLLGVLTPVEVVSPFFCPWNYKWCHYQWEPLPRPCDRLCEVRKVRGLRFHSRSTLYWSLLPLLRPPGSSFLKILLKHFVEEFFSLLLSHALQCLNHHVWAELYVVDFCSEGGCWCISSYFWNIISVIHDLCSAGIGSRGEILFLPGLLRAISEHVPNLSAAKTPSFFAKGFLLFIGKWF